MGGDKLGSYKHETVYSKFAKKRDNQMDKKSYRVRNWREYNQSLVGRGSITFWIDESCVKDWRAQDAKSGRGRPQQFSDKAIESCLTLKALFALPYRAVQGLITSLFKLMKVAIQAPDYSLLCKRQKTLNIRLPKQERRPGENLHLALDTTGLKVYGEGEWKVKQHGWVKHRLWRKFHLAINTQTHYIEAFELTDLGVQDCEGAALLMKQITDPVDSVRGDGAYDRFSCYEQAREGNYRLIAPPQRKAKLSTERKKKIKADALAIRDRDEQVKKVRDLGRVDWKKQSDYHRRSLAETAMFRVKTLLGNRLSTRKMENQKVEAAIWCKIINKMTTLGMPQTVAID